MVFSDNKVNISPYISSSKYEKKSSNICFTEIDDCNFHDGLLLAGPPGGAEAIPSGNGSSSFHLFFFTYYTPGLPGKKGQIPCFSEINLHFVRGALYSCQLHGRQDDDLQRARRNRNRGFGSRIRR